MIAIWIITAAVVAGLCFHEYKMECREYRAKHGMSKAEFRHYRKMMTDSSYRAKHKKSPDSTELFDHSI